MSRITSISEHYQQIAAELLRFCVSRVKNRSDAEDIFQEAWLKIVRNFERFDGMNFRAWAFSILRNSVVDYLRKTRIGSADFEAIGVVDSKNEPALDLLHHSEESLRLNGCIEKLPSTQKSLFGMLAIGQSYSEISSKLEVPEGTIASRRNRMIKLLQDCLGV